MAYAIQYSRFGGPDVLEFNAIDAPVAGPGQVTVRIDAAGVNPIDVKLRTGFRPSAPPTSPRGTGFDGAGVVTSLGESVDGLRVGDRVAISGGSGVYATDIAVDASKVTALPAQVDATSAAGVGVPFGTAYQALRSLAVGAGDTLLIHGGSGAVGQAAIQFATLWGARVIATTSDRRAERVRSLGAEAVRYGEGLVDRVRALGEVTVILDCAGSDEALRDSLALLEDRSRIATIVRGADAAELGIRAFSGGSPEGLSDQQEYWRREAVAVTLSLLAAGTFSVELGPSFPLDRAAEAQTALENGAIGKITLIP